MAAPNAGQLALLIACIALFALGGVLSVMRIRRDSERLRIGSKISTWSAIAVGIGVIAWHATERTTGSSRWVPLDDNFEALLWLGLILALFVLYVQHTHPIGGLDWFIMPMVILLLIGAGVFGRTMPHTYVSTSWSWTHRMFSYGGALAFVVAGAVGAMYLVANRRLRMKNMIGGPMFGSLERLEHVTLAAVTLGFALLTVGAITGFVWYARDPTHSISRWKIGLTVSVWVVYAFVLHSPINPRFRGRKAAMLSIIGCVLMLGLLVTVQLVNGK